MVPDSTSILVCALFLMSQASPTRIDMQVARTVVSILRSKVPNDVAAGQSEFRTDALEGDEATGSTYVYDERAAAESYHPFHWFQRTWAQGQKLLDDMYANHQQEKANKECQAKCRVSDVSYYPDCTNCISKTHSAARVQAELLRLSIPQCHCHMLSGKDLVFSLAP